MLNFSQQLCAPITLHGNHISLIPLDHSHAEGITATVNDGELYNLWVTQIPTPDMVSEEINNRLAMQKSGSMVPFTVVDRTGKIIGQTAYCNIDHHTIRLEIGYTFYARSVQGTAVNPEAKFLLLRHAFEVFGCVAVELRTDRYNHHSQAAIVKLGAQLDGVLRRQKKMAHGRIRDTYVYSILDSEWPRVQKTLIQRLDSYPDQ